MWRTLGTACCAAAALPRTLASLAAGQAAPERETPSPQSACSKLHTDKCTARSLGKRAFRPARKESQRRAQSWAVLPSLVALRPTNYYYGALPRLAALLTDVLGLLLPTPTQPTKSTRTTSAQAPREVTRRAKPAEPLQRRYLHQKHRPCPRPRLTSYRAHDSPQRRRRLRPS